MVSYINNCYIMNITVAHILLLHFCILCMKCIYLRISLHRCPKKWTECAFFFKPYLFLGEWMKNNENGTNRQITETPKLAENVNICVKFILFYRV